MRCLKSYVFRLKSSRSSETIRDREAAGLAPGHAGGGDSGSGGLPDAAGRKDGASEGGRPVGEIRVGFGFAG